MIDDFNTIVSHFYIDGFLKYLRISRWIDEEEEKQRTLSEIELQYVILDMSGKC